MYLSNPLTSCTLTLQKAPTSRISLVLTRSFVLSLPARASATEGTRRPCCVSVILSLVRSGPTGLSCASEGCGFEVMEEKDCRREACCAWREDEDEAMLGGRGGAIRVVLLGRAKLWLGTKEWTMADVAGSLHTNAHLRCSRISHSGGLERVECEGRVLHCARACRHVPRSAPCFRQATSDAQARRNCTCAALPHCQLQLLVSVWVWVWALCLSCLCLCAFGAGGAGKRRRHSSSEGAVEASRVEVASRRRE